MYILLHSWRNKLIDWLCDAGDDTVARTTTGFSRACLPSWQMMTRQTWRAVISRCFSKSFVLSHRRSLSRAKMASSRLIALMTCFSLLPSPTPFKTLDELRPGLDETLFHSSRYNPHHVLYPVASPAMAHRGTCPPRLTTVSFLAHFGVNLTTNYPNIV